MKTCLILISLLLLVSIGCDKEDSVDKKSDLVFSDSPFPLNGIPARFSKDIAYDSKQRTQFDIWLPESTTPTGLVIYTHGGGFSSGDKDFVYTAQQGGAWDFPSDIRFLLQNNIAFATVRYTLLSTTGERDGIKKPMSDVKRALQYIRYNAEDFNIDKTKIILAGNSAGGGTSLWIAFKSDLADAQNSDPVLRESTRVKGVVGREPRQVITSRSDGSMTCLLTTTLPVPKYWLMKRGISPRYTGSHQAQNMNRQQSMRTGQKSICWRY
jgi:hypothetical protein